MRWIVLFGLALPLAACRQTVVFDQTGGDGGVGIDSGPTFCTGLPTAFDIASPEVMVALDRSSGMSYARLGNSTVLAAARAGLDEFAARYQKVVRFGYVEFPGSSQVCTSCGSSQGCTSCGACAGTLSAPSANLEGFSFFLHACEQMSGVCPDISQRPTAAALTRCADVFGPADPIRRYVLLVTNGEPDCGTSQSSGCDVAQGLARDLYNRQQVVTVVLAPGQLDPNTSTCLQDVATAGGASSNFRPASTQTDLTNELGNITRTIAMSACHLQLLQSPISNESKAAVFWKNTQIPNNHNEGWDLDHNGFEVVLHGDWCEKLIEDGAADFAVFSTCNPPRP